MNKKIEKKFRQYCTSHGLRVTPPRLSALNIVSGAKKPVTAYNVLEKMGEYIKNPKPPTAYRALDFLSAHGFIHRIESLNAYVFCKSDHLHTGSQFMICDDCGKVEEVHLCTLPSEVEKKISSQKFSLKYWNMEVHGECSVCHGHETADSNNRCC